MTDNLIKGLVMWLFPLAMLAWIAVGALFFAISFGWVS